MTPIADIMTRDVHTIDGQQTVAEAARLMRQLDVGSLPVCRDGRAVGIVTDRDLVLRVVAESLVPSETAVSLVMSDQLVSCRPDDVAEAVLARMGHEQVRRLPVIDGQGHVVGIVAMADLARRPPTPLDIEPAVRQILEPADASVLA